VYLTTIINQFGWHDVWNERESITSLPQSIMNHMYLPTNANANASNAPPNDDVENDVPFPGVASPHINTRSFVAHAAHARCPFADGFDQPFFL
jgi:hypothetical protein